MENLIQNVEIRVDNNSKKLSNKAVEELSKKKKSKEGTTKIKELKKLIV
jgi:hypothetical protein